MNPLKNKNLLYTKTTAGKTVVDKEYAFCNTDKVNIREGKSTDARVIGTLSQNQVCYVLASKNQEWVYVESGDVRGFVKSEYLLMGEEAEEKQRHIAMRDRIRKLYADLLIRWSHRRTMLSAIIRSNQ